MGTTVSGSVDFEKCAVEYSKLCFFLPLVLEILFLVREPLVEKLSRSMQNVNAILQFIMPYLSMVE